MTTSDEAADRFDQFWLVGRQHLKLNPLPNYFGQSPAEAVPPPAWAFGDNPQIADELLDLVLAGKKTATAGALRDYEAENEPLPQVGDISMILDGHGNPRALIAVTDVEVRRFADVDGAHARREGEGDLSLEHWRAVHTEFFGRTGEDDEPVGDDLEVLLERFELVYSSPTSAG